MCKYVTRSSLTNDFGIFRMEDSKKFLVVLLKSVVKIKVPKNKRKVRHQQLWIRKLILY